MKSTNRASPSLLEDLWRDVCAALTLKAKQPKPQTDLLYEARAFLRNSKYIPVLTVKDLKQLDKLNAAYKAAVFRALDVEMPTGAILREVSIYLAKAKLERDIFDAGAHKVGDGGAVQSTPFPIQ